MIKREFEIQGIVCGMFNHVSCFIFSLHFLRIKNVTYMTKATYSFSSVCFYFKGVIFFIERDGFIKS